MCEFVADAVDMAKLSENEKQSLRQKLEERKKQLDDQVKALDEALRKIK